MNERYKEVKQSWWISGDQYFQSDTFKESNVRKSLAFSNHHEVRAAIMLEQGEREKSHQCAQNSTPGRAYTWFCKVLYDSTFHSQ